MTFLHASLLAGLAVTIIPILIHFSGRKQPKPIIFPALRFVKSTKLVAARGWSVKRWLLMILRVLMLALFVLAMASPRVNSASFASWLSIGLIGLLALFAGAATLLSFANRHSSQKRFGLAALTGTLFLISIGWSAWVTARGPTAPSQTTQGPVAAAIVVDNSPNMEYRFDNQTRLEKAKEIAEWIVKRLDSQSRIVVLTDSMSDRLQLGHAAALTQVSRLQTQGRSVNLLARIGKAFELVGNSNLQRKEVYVISDMSLNAWNSPDDFLKATIDEQNDILLQLVDVGLTEHRNWGFDQVQLTRDVAAIGSSVDVSATIQSARGTPSEQIVVELLSEKKDPLLPVVRDGKLVTPNEDVIDRKIIQSSGDGVSLNVNFSIADIKPGTNHFSLRITAADPLSIDNQWPLTVEGVAGQKLLVVDAGKPSEKEKTSPSKVGDEALILSLMLDPTEANTTAIPLAKFSSADLSEIGVTAIYNPTATLSKDDVDRLEKFVTNGGGLMLVLGDQMAELSGKSATDKAPIYRLLPGKIERTTRRTQRDVFLENLKPNHPIWREFGREIAQVPWTRFPIWRHWDIDELSPNASVIARYTVSGLPAIIEQTLGLGRIIVFTTPIPQLEQPGRTAWNELSTASEPWASFGLMLGTGRYLQLPDNTPRNFEVAQTVYITWNEKEVPKSFELFYPNASTEPIASDQGKLLFGFANQIGQYRLRGSNRSGIEVRGFSVHYPVGTTDLSRISTEQLDERLGDEKYLIANDTNSLRESIGQGRYGRNLTPFLLIVIVGMYLAEQAMSQRYYTSKRVSVATSRA